MKKKIKILFGEKKPSQSYILLMSKLFEDFEIINHDLKVRPDLIIFTGGEDVDPSFYNEKEGKFTYSNIERDNLEYSIFHRNSYKIPKLGICRGAQFLTVMCGGSLIQHVENHNSVTHSITLNTGEKINLPSDHHQMMYPFNILSNNYEILGHSTHFRSSVYLDGDNKNKDIDKSTFLEPEIVYYKNFNSLAIQAHPEWCDYQSKDFLYVKNLILKTLFKQ